MEVNLVFSNHPETRKEVWHFYDYSSREYMLPILHAGDSMLQILIEPVSLVRDRVLETLRLTASELKSDVSSHSTNPAYLVLHFGLEPKRFSAMVLEAIVSANSTNEAYKKRVATNPHLPTAAHAPVYWWPPHWFCSSPLHILYFSDSSYGAGGGT